ncbi:MAG TPA: PAS domain-containing sensor histidine kinase, partial [Planctomycetota bacterium]|nr:PAS domain-containing sensor histidine kinase [Planctomycetota bacterium]
SGAVSEETAVEAMKAGADDYFSKGNYARLVPAVERELHQADARRKAGLIERQLLERQAHLAAALQLAQVGTWHLDIVANTAIWSDEVCRIVGLQPGLAAPAFEALLERLRPEDRAELAGLLRHPSTKAFARELQLVRSDGATQFVNICGDIIRDADGNSREAAGTIRDVSERKAVETEIERTRVQLTAQNRKLVALTEQAHGFVDDVSHEFRTPLAVIKEFGSIIADGLGGPVTPDQAQYLSIIDNATLDLNQMVEDFLDSSKLRAGLLRVDRRAQRIDDLFARIRPGLQKKAAGRSIVLEECIEPGLPLVFADEEKARRVIMNLATNAVKFSPGGSRISLWARHAPGGGVEVGVSDEGRGLAPHDLLRLFERFRQVPAFDAPSLKGFGLGLNIARQLVWLNLGTMSVTSEAGHGSTFSFTLPADDPRLILECFFAKLAERDDAPRTVAVLSVMAVDSGESAEALRLFLSATTRPTDLVLGQHRDAGNGMLILGPTDSAERWMSRLSRARARALADVDVGEAGPGPIRLRLLGSFLCPAAASEAAACVLDHLAPELVDA